MSNRVTRKDLDRACVTLTAAMRERGEMHPEASFVAGGRNGYVAVDVTGGPHYGSGASTLIIGTTRECVEAVWAVSRARELGRGSFGRDA